MTQTQAYVHRGCHQCSIQWMSILPAEPAVADDDGDEESCGYVMRPEREWGQAHTAPPNE